MKIELLTRQSRLQEMLMLAKDQFRMICNNFTNNFTNNFIVEYAALMLASSTEKRQCYAAKQCWALHSSVGAAQVAGR